MIPPLTVYRMLIAELRAARQAVEWDPAKDTDTLDLIKDVYNTLTDEERETVDSEGGQS